MPSSASGLDEAKTDGKPPAQDWFSDEAALPIQAPVPSDSFAVSQEWKHPLLLPAWKPTCLQGLSVAPGIVPLASDTWPPLGWDMMAELLRLEGNTEVWGVCGKKLSQTSPLTVDASAHPVTAEKIPRSP